MVEDTVTRVLVDYRPALRARSGAGEYVHELVRALARRNDPRLKLAIFSSSWKDRISPSAMGELGTVDMVDRRVPVRVLNALWHRAEWPAVERLARRDFDVVHSSHPLLMPSRSAARFITLHDLHFLDHVQHVTDEIRRDYPQLVRNHAARADRVVVPSRYTAARVETVLAVPAERVTVCPPGAPEWRENPAAHTFGAEASYLLFLGTLEPRKNVGSLLDAYARLAARRTDIPDLVLAGRATDHAEPWLRRLALPPLAGKARHVGYVEPGDRRALFAGARLLALPSLDEGFGLPALEAMTLGVPVVASARGALPEVLGDAGLLVEPDAEALAHAIERVVCEPGLAATLAERGRRRARLFSWAASAQLLADTYVEAGHAGRRTRVPRR